MRDRSQPSLCGTCSEVHRELTERRAHISTNNGYRVQSNTDELSACYSFGGPESDVEQGAKDGCPLCRLFRWAVLSYLTPGARLLGYVVGQFDDKKQITLENFRTFKLWPVMTWEGDGPVVLRRLNIRSLPKMNLMSDAHLELRCADGRAASFPFAPSADPRDPKVLSLARSWLVRCRDEHRSCAQGVVLPSYAPSRLLEIVRQRYVRLVNTQAARYDYMALSYCWGKTDFEGTTRGSLKRYMDGVKSDSLPRTIHHALEVADALGLQHVWIDALCIIQDDRDDWKKEAARMAYTYAFATLTLAASSSISSDDGFLDLRKPAIYPLVPAKIAGSLLMPARPNLGDLVSRKWRRRAWTMQEELLSRRILYWDRNMLYWDCHERLWFEWGDNEETMSTQNTDHHWTQRVKLTTAPASINGQVQITDHENFFWLWDQARMNYMDRDISFPEDWSIAIRGVAGVFQDLRPNDKLSWGMWKDRFIEDLFWDFAPTPPPRPVPAARALSGAPTWSWFYRLSQGEVRSSLYSDFVSWEAQTKAECMSLDGMGDQLFPEQATALMQGWLMDDWLNYVHREDHDVSFWGAFDGIWFMPLICMHPSSDEKKESKRLEQFVHEVRGLYLRPKDTRCAFGKIRWELVAPLGPARTPVLPMTASQLAEVESRPRQLVLLV